MHIYRERYIYKYIHIMKIFKTIRTRTQLFINIFETLRTGARFSSKFSIRSAQERDFDQNIQDAPHENAILMKRERSGTDQFDLELA